MVSDDFTVPASAYSLYEPKFLTNILFYSSQLQKIDRFLDIFNLQYNSDLSK